MTGFGWFFLIAKMWGDKARSERMSITWELMQKEQTADDRWRITKNSDRLRSIIIYRQTWSAIKKIDWNVLPAITSLYTTRFFRVFDIIISPECYFIPHIWPWRYLHCAHCHTNTISTFYRYFALTTPTLFFFSWKFFHRILFVYSCTNGFRIIWTKSDLEIQLTRIGISQFVGENSWPTLIYLIKKILNVPLKPRENGSFSLKLKICSRFSSCVICSCCEGYIFSGRVLGTAKSRREIVVGVPPQ